MTTAALGSEPGYSHRCLWILYAAVKYPGKWMDKIILKIKNPSF